MNKKLNELRIESFNHIADIFKRKGITKIEVNEINGCDAPILQMGDDDENTYTLDRVIISSFGRLTFEGSSSWDNIELTEANISTDSLVEIEAWLADYEDDINVEGLTDEQKDGICSEVDEYLSSIFEDAMDRSTILDAIIKEVYDYIEETADWSGYGKDEYCIDDIHTAVQVVLHDRIL